MRNLSQQEKEFAKKLLQLASKTNDVLIGNVVYNELTNVDIYLDYENQHIEYRFDAKLYNAGQGNFFTFARNFSWKIINYFNLLQYLEKNGMLFLYQESQDEKNSRYGGLIAGNQFIPSKIHDRDAVQLILEFSKKTIIINQAFRDYVENDFKTNEDVKHYQNMELAEENIELARENLEVAVKSNDAAQKSIEIAQKSLRTAKITIFITVIIFVLGSLLSFCIASMNKG